MLRVFSQEDVRTLLPFEACIPAVRQAMIELSQGRTNQMLRWVTPIAEESVLSAMAGVMAPAIGFGTKVISVFPGNFHSGRQSHQGVVVLFDPANGAPAGIFHAGEITRIRTAAASAVATDALARPDASKLAILGYGEQAQAHVEAIAIVRPLTAVRMWGRSADNVARVAAALSERLNILVTRATSIEEAVADADMICTTTAATDPVLSDAAVGKGTHLNLVGSSVTACSEVDCALVARARFFADHRVGVLAQGGEYLRAMAAGLVDERHVLGEIGDVLAGTMDGRVAADDVTIYKSLGHIVQDLAAARHIFDAAGAPAGATVPF